MKLLHSLAMLALLGAGPAFGGDNDPPATLHPMDETALRAAAMPAPAPTAVAPARPAAARNKLLERLLYPSADDGAGGFLRLLSHPFFGLLNADVSARDIVYGPAAGLAAPNADGSINLALPLTIGEINLQNIRTGATDPASFGSIQIRGLDLGRTVITVTPTR